MCFSRSPECHLVCPLPGWSPPSPHALFHHFTHESARSASRAQTSPVLWICTSSFLHILLRRLHGSPHDSTPLRLKKTRQHPSSLLLSAPNAQVLLTYLQRRPLLCHFRSVPFGSLPLETLSSYLDTRSGLQRNLSGASPFLSRCLSPIDSKAKNSGGSVIWCPNVLCEGKGDL